MVMRYGHGKVDTLSVYVVVTPSTPYTASSRASCRQVLSSMPREVNPSHVKAARLRESSVGWKTALKTDKVPDTDLARKSVCRIIRKLMSKAEAEAKAEADAEAEAKAEAEREAKREVAAADMQAKRKDLKAPCDGGAVRRPCP